jgi:hypothetical protein
LAARSGWSSRHRIGVRCRCHLIAGVEVKVLAFVGASTRIPYNSDGYQPERDALHGVKDGKDLEKVEDTRQNHEVVRAPHFKEMWPAIEIRPTEF